MLPRCEDWPAYPELLTPEADWVAAGLEHRPELEARRSELCALGDEAALARSSELEGSTLGLDAQRDDAWALGPAASLPLPLFDTGSARRDRAEAVIVEARHALVAAARAVVEEVRRAHASYAAARSTLVRAEQQLVPLQELRLAELQALLQVGETDQLALLLAEQELQLTRSRLVDLRRQASRSLARLELAAGGAGVAHEIGAGS